MSYYSNNNYCIPYNYQTCNPCCTNNTDIQNLISHVDETIEKNIDFVQYQLNKINEAYIKIFKDLQQTTIKQNEIITQLTELCENTQPCNHQCNTQSSNIMYTDTSQTHIFKPTTKIIFVTMVGGGGAGGLGYVSGSYYYAGGGGGAGACIIKKPIEIEENTIIKITIGKGGSLLDNIDGQNTIVEIITPNKTYTIIATGGTNGNPKKTDSVINSNAPTYLTPSSSTYINVSGGKGGNSDLASFLKGSDGENGNVSIPSQAMAIGGNGGSSALYKGGNGGGYRDSNSMHKGGNGGGNYFSSGGTGGTVDNMMGEDGKYGSGGGGCCPRVKIDFTQKLSGDGGNGMVLIEW